MKAKNKTETIYPIGFLQSFKKTWLFARTQENPEDLFLVSNTKKSPSTFSKQKEAVVIKNKLFKGALRAEDMDHLVSSQVQGKEIITFVYGKGKNKKLLLAIAKKENVWSVEHGISTIKEQGGIVSDYLYKDSYYITYYGESSLWVSASSDLKKWVKLKDPVIKTRPGFFDKGDLKFIASKICEKGILVFYDASLRDGEKMKLQIGVALFSKQDPKKLIWRSDTPIFEQEVIYESDLECKGSLFLDESVSFYWYATKQGILTASVIMPFSTFIIKKTGKKLERSVCNPILSPEKETWWQSEGTFNPAAVEIDGTTHLLFRAIGQDGISRVGYAASADGHTIDSVHPEPVFHLENVGAQSAGKKYDPIMYPSGGSWGGCEDPRIVQIGDMIYMTFNAFDSWNNIRVGLSSITEADFENNEWNWSEPILISPEGQRHKNWVLFPEKINGKFAILHNINAHNPNQVYVEYFDTLDSKELHKNPFRSPDPQLLPNKPITWHLRMRSAGPPPLKTDAGWLVLYHATDTDPSRYKMGAMLLDLNDPTKILSRAVVPVLTPDMWYENDWKPGIVYACGAVIKNDTLFIYYGGGDKHVCVATTPLQEFLTSMKENKGTAPFLTKVIIS